MTAERSSATAAQSAATKPRRLLRTWSIALLLYLVVTASATPEVTTVVNDLAWLLAAALATVSCARTALSLQGNDRVAWMSFAAAGAAWSLGQIAWNTYELILGITVPFPSYADIGYLTFSLLMIVGLFALRATQEERGLTWLRAANLGLILLSLAVVLITSFTQPFAEPKRTLASSLVALAESATTTLAFILAIYFLWSYRWGARILPYTLLTLSLGAQMVSHLLYARELIAGEYDAMSFFNVGWLLAFALQQGAAETQKTMRTRIDAGAASSVQQSHGWVEALVPSFLVLCLAITAASLAQEITARTIYLSAIVLGAFAVLLAVREGWLYVQGQRLHGELDTAAAALARARQQLQSLQTQRQELERQIDVTARAGAVGLWDWDLISNKVSFSREWKRQLGYEEHEIAGDLSEWSSRLHSDDVERVTGALRAFLENPRGEYTSEQRVRHRDGSYRWVLVQGNVVLSNGRPVRMLGSQVDITPFKLLELSLRESEQRYRELIGDLESRVARRTQQLTEAYRESQNFAHAVAHDLKTPLRAIDGYCALLQEAAMPRLTETERNFVAKARNGAVRLATMIDGLLSYSRIEHREQSILAVNVRAFVEGFVQPMKDVLQESRIELRVDLQDRSVMADREGLRIILSNLLENAIKFTRHKGAPRIEITSALEDDRYVLKVQDNGVGFDPAYRDKIFDIFHRLNASGYEGTGIGLALVRKAVQRMNGSVWVDAAPEQGATFFVSLPLAKSEETQSASS